MLGRLYRFELDYHTRQFAFWAVLVIMFLLGFASVAAVDALGGSSTGDRLKVNGAFSVGTTIVGWDQFAMFFAAIFTAGGLLRDRTFQAVETIHATPVNTRDMVLARILGVLTIVFSLIATGALGMFIAQFMPWMSEESLGPVNVLYFLQPLGVFTLVNTVILVGIYSLVAGITQSRLLTLVSAVVVLALSLGTGLVSGTDAAPVVAALVEPFGAVAYGNETEFWSVGDRNTQLLPLAGHIGLNRLLWGVLGLLGLVAAYRMFVRGLDGARRSGSSRAADAPPPTESYAPVSPRTGLGATLATFAHHAAFDAKAMMRSIPFAILAGVFLVLYLLIFVFAYFLSPQKVVPTSEFMLSLGVVTLLIPMVFSISFFSGEVVWRDRTHKMTEIAHATPVANGAVIIGKWFALFAVVAVLAVLPAVLGFIIQAVTPGPAPELGVYLGNALFSTLPTFLSLTAFALFLQSFSPNRIVGMLLAFGGILALLFGLPRLPFSHPLMDFTGTSPGSLSDMGGYTQWIRFRWYNLYALGIFSVLGVVAVWLARRGVQGGVLSRLRGLPRRFNRATLGALAAGLVVAVFAGANIQRSLDKVDYRVRSEREARAVAWEKLLLEDLERPTPTVTDVSLFADLYPSRQEATISGTMTITNVTDAPIAESYVDPAVSHEEDVIRFDVEGATVLTDGETLDGKSVAAIRDYNIEIVRFDPPLAPGETREVTFETYFHPPRLNDGSAILPNGTFLNNLGGGSPQMVPTFGLGDRRLRNPAKRRKYELDELDPMAERDDAAELAVNFFGSRAKIMLDAKLCTDEGQTAVAPGRLVSESVEDGRACFSYATNAPISNFYNIVSAEYDTANGEYAAPDGRRVPITVFHHPGHTYSVDTMINAVEHGLSVYEREFGPYELDYFRILEVPYIGFAQAFAGTIPFSEMGFIVDPGDPEDAGSIDNAAAVTLHELGHQWFGHQVTPARVKGFNVLSEGLTSYATTLAYEELYGFDRARTLLEKGVIEPMAAMTIFNSEKEVPVALAESQGYLHYQKPDWILWGLRHYIGADAVNAALRTLIADFDRGQSAPFPSTLDVVAALKAEAPKEYHGLIDDQWNRITWWSLSPTEDADVTVTPTADGRYTVSIPLTLDKKINHSDEDEEKQVSVTEIEGESLNEWVEIGFYADKPSDKWSAWQALERVRVTEADSVLEFTVDEAPAYVALDPRRLLQERNVLDNVITVERSTASLSGAN